MATSSLSYAEVKELLEYRPEEDGPSLVWKVDRGNQIRAGQTFGNIHHSGYWHGRINNKSYRAHRVVWLLCTGAWPKDQLDHINGIKTDNRIENLREATQQQNQQNRKCQTCNTSGLLGVSFHKRSGKWSSQIRIDKKKKHLGLFNTPEEAHEKYKKAKAVLHTFQPTIRTCN